jgi:hypothetical protein
VVWCVAQSQSGGLLAKTDNARQIANILSSLHLKKDIVRPALKVFLHTWLSAL